MDIIPNVVYIILAVGLFYLLLGVRDWLSSTGAAREELARAARYDAKARLVEMEHKCQIITGSPE